MSTRFGILKESYWCSTKYKYMGNNVYFKPAKSEICCILVYIKTIKF
jgi:hypothetical protein